jgi:hypothetical protein
LPLLITILIITTIVRTVTMLTLIVQ